MAANHLDRKGFEDDATCPICLGLFEDPRLLPCSHTLCYQCIKGVVRASGNFQCPYKCGITLSEQQISQLPLNRVVENIVDRIKKGTSSVPKINTDKPIPHQNQQASVQKDKETLNLSILQGLEKKHDFFSSAYGYQFRLSKPMKLLSVEVKVDVNGPVIVFITTSFSKNMVKKSTSYSTSGLKWLKIPIVAEMKNQYIILVYSSVENATFAFKHAKSFDFRPINQICSVTAGRTSKLDESNFDEFFSIQYDCRSIEMRIEVER